MNASRVISAMSLFIFLMFSFWDNALAENDGDWCTGVTVLGAGSNVTSKVVLLKHSRTDCGAEWPANTPRWFILNDSSSNSSAMLAAALTAQATGKTIVVVGKNLLFHEWNPLDYVATFSTQ